jgi:hypothetical protein
MTEAINSTITENVLDIIIAVISIVVSYYIIPAIKNDLVPWLKDKRIYDLVKRFVEAAEKLAETGAIDKSEKKQKVIEFLEEKGIIVTVEIEAFIESAVKQLDLVTDAAKDEILNNE